MEPVCGEEQQRVAREARRGGRRVEREEAEEAGAERAAAQRPEVDEVRGAVPVHEHDLLHLQPRRGRVQVALRVHFIQFIDFIDFFVARCLLLLLVFLLFFSLFHAEFHRGRERRRGGDGQEGARRAGAARQRDGVEQAERLRCA